MTSPSEDLTGISATPERTIARLLLVLYYCGEPITNLLEGETRLIESKSRLRRFDFWMREPGLFGMALLHLLVTVPDQIQGNNELLRTTLDRLLDNQAADKHRIPSSVSYSVFADLDHFLGHLTGYALISDRPSLTKTKGQKPVPQLTLEPAGIALAQKILSEAPSFKWYQQQGEAIAKFFPLLDSFDLNVMSFLRPELSPTQAATMPLSPFILQRMSALTLSAPTPESAHNA